MALRRIRILNSVKNRYSSHDLIRFISDPRIKTDILHEVVQKVKTIPNGNGHFDWLENFYIEEDVIFQVVEQMPKFGNGDADLLNYLAKNIKYPQTQPLEYKWTYVVSKRLREFGQGRVRIGMSRWFCSCNV